MIDLAENPWYYLAHYAHGDVVGCIELDFQARLNTPTDIAIVRGKIAQHNGVDPGRVILTGLTLVSGPDDRDDTEEWRQTMAIHAEARQVAATWRALPLRERTFIGDQLGLTDLANDLDALVQVVRDADG